MTDQTPSSPANTANQHQRPLIAFLVAVFLVSFGVRVYHPESAPEMWQHRAQVFASAVLDGNWADTYQSPHPGFATMAVAGFPIRAYDDASPATAAFIENLLSWVAPPVLTSHGWDMVIGVTALAFFISLLIVVIAWSLWKLAGWQLAIAGTVMLSFAPLFLGETRVFHVNGDLAALMLVSAFMLFLYVEQGKWRYLIFSAAAGGLAVMTKTPAAFMLPFTGLVLGQKVLFGLVNDWTDHPTDRPAWLIRESWRGLLLPLVVWFAVALAMFGLWPVMWVQPMETLRNMFTQSADFISKVEPRFVLGEEITDAPGARFYPLAMLYMVSLVTWPLTLFALVTYIKRFKSVLRPVSPLIFWSMVEFIFFFVVEMTIGAKQSHRYILPALAMLALVGAVGLVGLANFIKDGWPAHRRKILVGVMVATLGLHVSAVLSMMPSYGLYRNHLLGGVPAAYKVVNTGGGQREGMFLAYQYINQYNPPDAKLAVTHHYYRRFLLWYTVDEAVIADEANADTDWYLFDAEYRQNRYEQNIRQVWNKFKDGPPNFELLIDGMPYFEVYAADDAASAPRVTVHRGGRAFIVLGWLWVLMLIGGIVWSGLRQKALLS